MATKSDEHVNIFCLASFLMENATQLGLTLLDVAGWPQLGVITTFNLFGKPLQVISWEDGEVTLFTRQTVVWDEDGNPSFASIQATVGEIRAMMVRAHDLLLKEGTSAAARIAFNSVSYGFEGEFASNYNI